MNMVNTVRYMFGPYTLVSSWCGQSCRIRCFMLVLYTDRIGLTSDGMFSDSDRMEKNRILLRYTIFVHFTPFRLNPVQSEIYSSSFGSDRIGTKSDGFIRSVYSNTLCTLPSRQMLNVPPATPTVLLTGIRYGVINQ